MLFALFAYPAPQNKKIKHKPIVCFVCLLFVSVDKKKAPAPPPRAITPIPLINNLAPVPTPRSVQPSPDPSNEVKAKIEQDRISENGEL